MKIVVGLGNFGDRYAYNYHNLGFLAVECLADKLGVTFKKRECDSLIAVGYVDGEKVVLAKPVTFMNLSGVAVLQLLKKHKADLNDLLVIYDDIDLNKFALRKREKGSSGTHNGMRNIVECLGSGDFCRLRIGTGRPPEYVNLSDFVLSDIKKEDRQGFFDCLNQAADIAIDFIKSAKLKV